MPLLFDAVQALLVRVLTMSDETRVLGRPCGVRSPFVIEHRLAEFIAAGTGLESLSLRKQSVAGAESTTVTEGDLARRRLGPVFERLVDRVLPDHELERAEKFGVTAHELIRLEDQDILGDQLLGPEIEKLEELGKGGPVANVLLRLLKKGKVVLKRDGQRGWRERFGHDRCQCGLDKGRLGRIGFVGQLRALVGCRRGRLGSSQAQRLRLL